MESYGFDNVPRSATSPPEDFYRRLQRRARRISRQIDVSTAHLDDLLLEPTIRAIYPSNTGDVTAIVNGVTLGFHLDVIVTHMEDATIEPYIAECPENRSIIGVGIQDAFEGHRANLKAAQAVLAYCYSFDYPLEEPHRGGKEEPEFHMLIFKLASYIRIPRLQDLCLRYLLDCSYLSIYRPEHPGSAFIFCSSQLYENRDVVTIRL